MTGTEIFKRSATYDREAPTIRLHAPHWKLLLAFDGQRTLAEVALGGEVTFVDALPMTEQFLEHKWIEEQPITLDQYLKRSGAVNISAIGAAVPPAVILYAPKPESGEPAAIPAVAKESPLAVSATPDAPSAETSPTAAHGPMRLSAVVDEIISYVGNTALGQLLVYRVFLRVPPELLQAEEIVSVHMVNDSSLIRSPALQQAVAGAVKEVAKRALPDSVFAPA